jgi:hypothetical protein
MRTYEQTKANALTHLGHIQAGTHQLQEILKNAKRIRHEGYGVPEWAYALQRAVDELGRAVAHASRNAEV